PERPLSAGASPGVHRDAHGARGSGHLLLQPVHAGLAHVDALAGHDRAHSDRGEGALRAPRLSGVRPAEEPSLAARLVMKTMTAKTKAKATKPLQLLLLGG